MFFDLLSFNALFSKEQLIFFLKKVKIGKKEEKMVQKILIVEDNELNMRLFNDLLEMQGYEVCQCLIASEALAKVRDFHPDLILMDIQMPEISGLELTEKIRASSEIADVKIIAVTAFAMQGDKSKILEAGCDDYISKPIQIQPFLTKIKETLAL